MLKKKEAQERRPWGMARQGRSGEVNFCQTKLEGSQIRHSRKKEGQIAKNGIAVGPKERKGD